MKTIILIILTAIGVSAQDVIINGTYNSFEIQKNKTYRVTGNSTIHNLNWNGKDAKFIVDSGVILNLTGSMNVNAFGTVINNGTLLVGGWIDLNSITKFESRGSIVSAGMQNNTRVVIDLCGSLSTGTLQLNNAGINAVCCLLVTTNNLDINTPNAFSGQVHVIITNNINLNHIFSSDPQVTYMYNGQVNHPIRWGSAQYFSSCKPKCDPSLPVTIEYFRVTNNKPVFKFVEVKDVDYVEVERSTDLKDWKVDKRFNNVQPNKEY